jgi:hypothetical protein
MHRRHDPADDATDLAPQLHAGLAQALSRLEVIQASRESLQAPFRL